MRNKIKVLLIFILIMSMFNMVYPVNAAELEEGSSHHYDMSLVQRDVVQSIISSLSIPYSLSKQSILPDLTNSQAAISWTSSEIGLISPDGQIDPGFDDMKNVTLTATVSYMGNTASKDFDVLVMGRDSSYILSYYRSGQTPKITYNIGEPLNVTGMSVTSVYSDKSKKTLNPSDYQISGFNSEVPGVKTITITYQGKTAVFSVTVKEMPPSKYIITYKLNGGKNNNANPSSYTTETVVLKDPVRAKHIFQGWYTDSNFKTRVVNVSGKNITVYAKWKKVTVGRAKISLKNKKVRKLTVNIKKVTGAKGYQISYSTSRKFKKKYTKNTIVMKNSKTLKKLKKGKIYYVKVRAYKLDSKGNKIYGKYSEVRQITIRK